jgi:hypothetical protein
MKMTAICKAAFVAATCILLACSTINAQQQQSDEHTGTLRVLISDFLDKTPEYQYYLEDPITHQRHLMHVARSSIEQGLQSGHSIKVKGSFVNGKLHAESVRAHQRASINHQHMNGLAMSIPSTGARLVLVIPDFSNCAINFGTTYVAAPTGNVTQFQNVFFESSNPTGYTAGMQLRSCSHGSFVVDDANSVAFRFKVPAANCSTGTSYFANHSTCPTDWSGLTTDLRNLAAAQGLNWTFYSNHWMFLPKAWSCGFGGLGWVGADGLWVPDQYYNNIQIILHEFGHNFGMNHAAKYTNGVASEYGDASAMMGNQRDVCYCTANRETSGWQTVPTVNIISFTLGTWTNYDLPAQDKNENQGLKIVTPLLKDGSTNVNV